MSGSIGGRWPSGHPRRGPLVPGRCAAKRHHFGLIGTSTDNGFRRGQRPTLLYGRGLARQPDLSGCRYRRRYWLERWPQLMRSPSPADTSARRTQSGTTRVYVPESSVIRYVPSVLMVAVSVVPSVRRAETAPDTGRGGTDGQLARLGRLDRP